MCMNLGEPRGASRCGGGAQRCCQIDPARPLRRNRMVQGAVTGGKPMAGNFRTLPGPPLPPAAGAVNSVTARSGQARRSEADPAAAQRPPAHNAAAPRRRPLSRG